MNTNDKGMTDEKAFLDYLASHPGKPSGIDEIAIRADLNGMNDRDYSLVLGQSGPDVTVDDLLDSRDWECGPEGVLAEESHLTAIRNGTVEYLADPAAVPAAHWQLCEELSKAVDGDADKLTAVLGAIRAYRSRTKPAEFMLHQEDMEFLARAYLDKAIGLHCYYFFTGGCDGAAEAMRLEARFETVAEYLGETKRQEIIDALDEHKARRNGDSWQVFKSSWEDFWSTPADREAILRLAATLPDDLSEIDTAGEFYEVLEQARGGRKPEEEDSRDVESEILDPVDPKKVN